MLRRVVNACPLASSDDRTAHEELLEALAAKEALGSVHVVLVHHLRHVAIAEFEVAEVEHRSQIRPDGVNLSLLHIERKHRLARRLE